jgi:hypothetical protein
MRLKFLSAPELSAPGLGCSDGGLRAFLDLAALQRRQKCRSFAKWRGPL